MSPQQAQLAADACKGLKAPQTKTTSQAVAHVENRPKPNVQVKVESEHAKKKREMKELFRDIDRKNFPPGARLTSNFAGHISRGGGFMSERSK